MKTRLDPPQRRMLFISESTICLLPEIVVIVVIVESTMWTQFKLNTKVSGAI